MKRRRYEQYCDNPDLLKGLNRAQLQVLWAEIFKGRHRPQSINIIISQIAYYVQEKKQGRLSVRAHNHINRRIEDKVQQPLNKYTFENSQQLVREWNGKQYHVVVVDKNAFEYDGRIYKTLSAVAKEITGAHWSGPLFFGLRKQTNGKRK